MLLPDGRRAVGGGRTENPSNQGEEKTPTRPTQPRGGKQRPYLPDKKGMRGQRGGGGGQRPKGKNFGGVGLGVFYPFVVGFAVIQVLSTTASVWAAEFGTAEEAKAMLERAVAAVKEDKAKALDMFNKGEGGFKDRDLYVFCANASDGIITAHPLPGIGQTAERH